MEVSPSSHATTNRGVSELSSRYYKSKRYGECKTELIRVEIMEKDHGCRWTRSLDEFWMSLGKGASDF